MSGETYEGENCSECRLDGGEDWDRGGHYHCGSCGAKVNCMGHGEYVDGKWLLCSELKALRGYGAS